MIVFPLNHLDFKLFYSSMIIGCAGFIYINMYILLAINFVDCKPCQNLEIKLDGFSNGMEDLFCFFDVDSLRGP